MMYDKIHSAAESKLAPLWEKVAINNDQIIILERDIKAKDHPLPKGVTARAKKELFRVLVVE